MSRKKIILYNPKAVFFDMPLALLAIGSALNDKEYEVIIIDGRICDDVEGEIRKHIDEALCVGMSVITGAPIADALKVATFVKGIKSALPVIWGGWHTSLFPTETLRDSEHIDITVQGQGEETFKELVDHLSQNLSIDNIKGISFRKNGEPHKNPPRPMVDMDSFGRVNYDLIDIEAYFKKKKKRQFDYISSIGCFFRCAFCADPFVFQRKFSAISPEKLGEEMEYYQKKYKFTDLNFQDETFFTYAKRINGIANEFINRNLNISWAATMRADQGSRLSDEIWALCKESGLRRLLIGVESGSQEMMDWMKKDVKLEQVFYCAEKCKDLGIGVIFPFIVGFPGESDQSVVETVKVIKKLRSKSHRFDTPIFYFKPYPGSTITNDVVKNGYVLPETLNDWSKFDYIGSSGPWVSKEKERFFENFKFFLKVAYNEKGGFAAYPIRKMGQWRINNDNFKLPLEKYIYEKLVNKPELS
ncbi:MAG: B12-binding domain-containing radical SAM protein [Flavobacteriales bacterium]|nr:B12-binding domain-containing radical SAM protein [Flavobacteriales bacterium]